LNRRQEVFVQQPNLSGAPSEAASGEASTLSEEHSVLIRDLARAGAGSRPVALKHVTPSQLRVARDLGLVELTQGVRNEILALLTPQGLVALPSAMKVLAASAQSHGRRS
jgi:hypothetical protein